MKNKKQEYYSFPLNEEFRITQYGKGKFQLEQFVTTEYVKQKKKDGQEEIRDVSNKWVPIAYQMIPYLLVKRFMSMVDIGENETLQSYFQKVDDQWKCIMEFVEKYGDILNGKQ